MFAALAEPTRRLLADAEATLNFVDVGARNGVIVLATLAPFVEAYGFEPNPRYVPTERRLMRLAAETLELTRRARHPAAAVRVWRGWREDRRRKGYMPFERFEA